VLSVFSNLLFAYRFIGRYKYQKVVMTEYSLSYQEWSFTCFGNRVKIASEQYFGLFSLIIDPTQLWL
jgi:hypothetical protein